MLIILSLVVCILLYWMVRLQNKKHSTTYEIDSFSSVDQKAIVLAEMRDTEKQEITEEARKEIEYFKRFLVRREYLMTPTEKDFFEKLKTHLADTAVDIFSKVRLADIVNIKEQWKFESKVVFNKIKSKHIDFVVADHDGKILACIELDDYSHKKGNRADYVKDTVCEIAGVMLLRMQVGDEYDFSEIITV